MSTVKSKIIRGLAGDGAAGFDNNGVLWQTADITTASDNVGGNGWYRPDGQDRVWQDVTASRAVGVTYTNDTGREIYFSVTSTVGADKHNVSLYIDGTALSRCLAASGGELASTFTWLAVPNGSTYKAGIYNNSLFSWMEYR